MLDKVVRRCILLIVIGLLLEEAPSMVMDFLPRWAKTEGDWFLRPTFHYSVQHAWMLKFITDSLWDVIRAYIICVLAKRYSMFLFYVCVLYFGYEIVGFVMLFWDFKTNHALFYYILILAWIILEGLVKQYSPETIGKVKSLF